MATTPVFSWPYQGLLDPPNGALLGEQLALAIEATVAPLAPLITVTTAWSTYAPVIVGSGSNPTNYSVTGRWVGIGKATIVMVQVIAGGGFTPGSGDYSISLPVTANLAITPTAGSFRLFDSSTGNAILGARPAVNSATTFGLQVTTTYAGSLTNVGAVVPWTWAANDIMDGFIICEAV